MARDEYGFERYQNVRSAYGASFSPDGSRLSFLSDITGVPEVWAVALDAQRATPPWPEQITFRGERAWSARFAPTGDALLVTGDVGASELNQHFLVSGDGAQIETLTPRADRIYQFGGWSPDGTRISFASNERNPRYFDVYEQDVRTQAVRALLTHDGTTYAGPYSPDGRCVLVSRVLSNTRNALLLVDTTTGEARALTPEDGEGHGEHVSPAWSADRRGLYLISDRGRQFRSLASLDLTTTDLTYLRPDAADAEELAVTGDGRRLALVTNTDGYSTLELFDVAAGWDARRDLPAPALPKGVVREITWSRDGARLAFTLDVPDDAADVWVWDLGERRLWRATRSATGGIPRERFVAPSLVAYPTFDGREIPAFLFTPQGVEARDLPVVVYVHGGPESQFRPQFMPILQFLVGHGYAVLAPNVRGSTGYGYAYQSLDDVRLRMDSVADLKAAVLWLRAQGIADPKRVAVFGRSYGGFMVLSAVTTYPDLWAAGVDIVGIANWVTFLEHTGPWRRPWRETEYGSLEHDREFLEAISPIRSVEQITAPMFVAHGANDPRVPVGEAEQIVAALRARAVPVEYLRFEDEGHQFTKRANQIAAYTAMGRFLDQYLTADA